MRKGKGNRKQGTNRSNERLTINNQRLRLTSIELVRSESITAEHMEVFPISPASSKPLCFIAIIGVILTLVLVVLVQTGYSSLHSKVELEKTQIRLVGDFWGRTIPLKSLEVSEANILDLNQRSPYSLKYRTLGTGLPGYASGWFRLRSGQKALVYLTRQERIIYLPTSLGYVLMLSVEKPEQFIETLQRYANNC